MEEETPSPLGDPEQKLILIVEDDDHVRSILETLLLQEGFQVATAVDGVEALASVEKRVPALIVSDLMMSRQGGYEFLRELKARGIKTPVVVITGSKLNDSTIDVIKQEGNVVDFARKPLALTNFVMSLHARLGTQPRPGKRPRGINER